MGDFSLVYVHPEEGTEWTLKTPPVKNTQIGDTVTPYLQSNKIHLFDGETGINLLIDHHNAVEAIKKLFKVN
jgi:hypothetical protein